MFSNTTLAVVSQTGESLSFFSLPNGERTTHLTNLIPEPHELAYSPSKNLLYLTHAYAHGWYGSHGPDGHQISIIDCTSRSVVDVLDTSPGRGPHYCLLAEEQGLLYVCVEGGLGAEGEEKAGGIVAIDLQTKAVVKKIRSGWKAHWFVLTPDGRKAYTCHKEADFVSVIDLVAEKVVKKIAMPDGCEQPSISRDGRFVYYPNPTVGVVMQRKGGPFSVRVVDTEVDEVVREIPLEFPPLTTHVDAQGRLLVGQYRFDPATGQNANGRLSVFTGPSQGEKEADAYAAIANLEVGKAPLTLMSTPDGSTAFAANTWSGTVSIVDMADLKVAKTLEVDCEQKQEKIMLCGAHGMALVP